jgi:hypothetical protein
MLFLFPNPEAEGEPEFAYADGRRVSTVDPVYAGLFAEIGHRYELTPGNDPGDGTFRLPAMNENATNLSKARMPIGEASADAAIDARGKALGSIGHTHGPGSLALPSHSHGAGTLYLPNHGHGHSFTMPDHVHFHYNDSQRTGRIGDETLNGSIENAFLPNEWFAWTWGVGQFGLSGGIGGQGNVGLGGSAAAAAPGTLTGESAAEDPPFLTGSWFVKL